jgi:hypothetical protein
MTRSLQDNSLFIVAILKQDIDRPHDPEQSAGVGKASALAENLSLGKSLVLGEKGGGRSLYQTSFQRYNGRVHYLTQLYDC